MDQQSPLAYGAQEALARNVVGIWGDAGRAWLLHLPQLIAEYERRWQITILPPFPNLSYNYVAPARRSDGTAAVFKAGVLDTERLNEIAALQHYNGHGVVRLLEADLDQGAQLLERVQPGIQLATLDDDEQATAIAINILRQLWQPAPPNHTFPDLTRWIRALWQITERFDGGTGPLPKQLVVTAQQLAHDLIRSHTRPTLLHGDFHHYNILSAERQPWLAIDPKGVVGDPGFDLGAFLRNPFHTLFNRPHPDQVLARRVDQLSEALELERDRVAAWGFTESVLSACWDADSHGDPSHSIAVAHLLRDLL